MTKPVPGSPDDVFAQTREIRRQAGLMRSHARTVSTTVGNQVSGWSGTASVAYAGRSGQHSRAAGSGATTLETACSSADRFARDLRRLQGLANGHLKTRDRLVGELELALRDRRHPQLLAPDERRGLDDDIADLRRRIRNEDNAIDRQVNDYKGIKARLYGEIAKMLPPKVRAWWTATEDYRQTIDAGKTLVSGSTAAGGGVAYIRSVNAARAGMHTMTPEQVVAHLTKAEAGMARLMPKGDIADSRNLKVLKKVWDSKAGKWVLKKAGPVAALDTAYAGATDMMTGGGYEGTRGGITHVLGGGAAGGAVVLLVAPTAAVAAPIAGGVVLAWTVWKTGNAVYDNRNAIDRVAHKWTGKAATGVPTLSDSALRSLPPSPKVGCDAPAAPAPKPAPAPTAAPPRPLPESGTYNGRVYLPGDPQPYPGLERLYDANDRLTAAVAAQQPSGAPPVAVPTHPLVRTQEVAP